MDKTYDAIIAGAAAPEGGRLSPTPLSQKRET